MPEPQFRAQSPRPGAPVLPPLSKYYYGPAQGWPSTETSPGQNASTWDSYVPHEHSPALLTRLPSNLSKQSSAQWNSFSHHSQQAQKGAGHDWEQRGPSPSAPSADQFADSYALMPSSRYSVNPGWDSRPTSIAPDSTTLGVSHRQKQSRGYDLSPSSKPSLPPRPYHIADSAPGRRADKTSKQEISNPVQYSKSPSSRVSATTIDVPLFLQPLAYNPDSAPPLPTRFTPPPHISQSASSPLPPPGRLPPPPPKIPISEGSEMQNQRIGTQLPRYDPQGSLGDAQYQQSPSSASRQPQFDSHGSSDDGLDQYHGQYQYTNPSLPNLNFGSFDAGTALPGVPADNQGVPGPIREQQQTQSQNKDLDDNKKRLPARASTHKASTSSVRSGKNDQWTSPPTQSQSEVTHAPSSDNQHYVLSHAFEQSMSATDASYYGAGLSTPESQQTSNTSYRDSEDQLDHTVYDRRGDNSFYWHSGRSSSDVEERNGQDGSTSATPGDSSAQESLNPRESLVQREHHDLPVRSTSLSPTPLVSYGSSALGLGGPSDWEYFGDYEAEEVDDEELYSRRNTRVELPADSFLTEVSSFRKQSEPPAPRSITHHLPPVQEESTEWKPIVNSNGGEVNLNYEASTQCVPRPKFKSPSSQGPTTQHATSDKARSLSDHLASEEQRPDLDDVIRAWSEAPYIGVNPETRASNDLNPGLDETDTVAEASLASTPQERTLGIDFILKDAPSLPKLPDAIDQIDVPSTKPKSNVDPSGDISGQSKEWKGSEKIEPINLRQMRPNLSQNVKTEANVNPLEASSEVGLGEAVQVQQNSARPISIPERSSVSSEVFDHPSTPANEISDAIKEGQEGNRLLSKATETTNQKGTSLMDDTARSYDGQESSASNEEPDESEQVHSATSRHLSMTSEAASPLSRMIGIADAGSRHLHSSEQNKASAKNAENSNGLASRLSQTEAVIYQPRTDLDNKIPERSSNKSDSSPNSQHLGNPESGDSVPFAANFSQPSLQVQDTEDISGLNGHYTHQSSQEEEKTFFDAPNHGFMVESAQDSTEIDDREINHKPPVSEKTQTDSRKAIDPYSDLDPWGKASLNRFAAMLREEARADTNKDKLNIFDVFTSRESRLRVILYGTDDDLILPYNHIEPALSDETPEIKLQPEKDNGIKKTASIQQRKSLKRPPEKISTVNLERSLKALPALPANRDSIISRPMSQSLAPLIVHHAELTMKKEGKNEEDPVDDESGVRLDSPLDSTQYSPGGRPIVARLPPIMAKNEIDSLQSGKSAGKRLSVPFNVDASSRKSQDLEAPISADSEVVARPRKTTIESGSEVNNYITNRRSIYRPFATQTLESMETGSNFGRQPNVEMDVPPLPSFAAPRSQYNTALQVQKVDVASESKDAAAILAPVIAPSSEQRQFIDADFDPLTMVLPESEVVVSPADRLKDLRDVIEAVPDDFSFIHASVVAWDTEIKIMREENDRQRHIRQMKSEQRIDALFDDHEIGYGDISELEAEFKQSEAARKAEEDRSEYQTFVSDVFDLVWTRLHYELEQLVPHYEHYSKLMNDTLAGKDMFEQTEGGLALAPTMSSFLALHQKLEIRHQKAFEAVLERDRRLKKTEISPWYTLSNIMKVKQLEKQFEDAEKSAIIEYCQQRDLRANRLMDVLDQNTLRGVGANQDYMEAIMKAVRRIASGRAFASVPGGNTLSAGLEEVQKAKAITAILATSSEQIVQTFHVADMLLNSADYEVSVAKAKVSKADVSILVKLKEERAKEDQKLMRDLEHRLALIREDSRRTNDEIVKLMLFLGVQNGRATIAQTSGEKAADEHEARMQKALEDAKRRNAVNNAGS